ncbi:MAG: hypothetical protein LUD25_03030 [Coriobacteriaceae bacterium]|nr:hypothetical protein [Coriobacteriaceae bacterium]
MATVYLHIGLTKTASSSIQSFLAGNREVLEQHGFVYPDFGYPLRNAASKKNARFLIEPIVGEDGKKSFLRPSEHYAEGLDKVADLSKSYDGIILSDEDIWRHSGYREGFWPALKEDLDRRGLGVRIIVYLRRQDLWLQSHWQQNIKACNTARTFGDFLAEAEKNGFPYDFGAYIDGLADIFGKEVICVRVFEKDQFKGQEGSIYSDFLDIFGLTCDGFHVGQEYHNPSLRGSALEVQRLLNELPDARDHKSPLIRNSLLHLPEQEKTTLFPGGAAEQKAFLAGLEDSNSHVAREYLGREDGRLFYEPLEELPAQVFDDQNLIRDTIQAYGQALQTLEERVNDLQKEVEEMRKDNDRPKRKRSKR